ncbi:hypothetical protein D3C86_1544640 [compost metagenome]
MAAFLQESGVDGRAACREQRIGLLAMVDKFLLGQLALFFPLGNLDSRLAEKAQSGLGNYSGDKDFHFLWFWVWFCVLGFGSLAINKFVYRDLSLGLILNLKS